MAKIETTFIRPKELYTPDTGETKVVYDGYQNNPHELVVEENLEGEVSEIVNDTFVPNEGGNVVFTDGNDVAHELITKSGLGKAQVIETTWQELKDKRDNGQLIAGSLYRITDYNCTTTQENTQSAGHQFDIVLLALSENKLAEEGWAMMHENDTYFANSNLSAWKVWYCLDNDKSRFAWADPVNGKGVIYRLIDEFNNDIKYDFKNIQFKRKLTNGQYDATNGTETWCYTLNLWYNSMCQDASIVGNTLPNDEGFVNGVYDNIFGYATAYDFLIKGMDTFAFALGNNVVLSFVDEDGYFGIFSNKIGDDFKNNTFGNYFSSNTIGNYCQSNIHNRNQFNGNMIGNDFIGNKINTFFSYNIIANSFVRNTINKNFEYNIVGNSFNNKTISDNISSKNYGNNGVELATKS